VDSGVDREGNEGVVHESWRLNNIEAAATSMTRIRNVLLLNPFRYDGPQSNVGVDPVVSRHAGQEIKTGVTFPIGLAYMAATLLRAGYEVRMLDPIAERISIARIHENADWSQAVIMPFSAAHAEDVKKFRSCFPGKLLALCGGYSKFISALLLGENYCDVVLGDEPELMVVELMDSFPMLGPVKGIVYRNNGEIVTAPPRPLIEDLDEIPFPARHLLDPKRYWEISFFGEPTAWILPARGCPYDCIFCAQYDRNVKSIRRRSPGNIVDEIQEVVAQQRVTNFVFFDETFNVSDRYVRSVCDEILRRNVRVHWWCAARADLIREDTVRLMKRAGCIEMRIGLESANDQILAYLKKDITVAKIREGLETLEREGMNYSLQCIFGSPMETGETIGNTLDFLKEYRPLFVSFNILTPLPGSRLFDEIKERLTLNVVKSFDILHTQYPLGRYSAEELSRIIKRAYFSYYFSLGYLIRIAREMTKRPRIILQMVRTGMRQVGYICNSILFHRVKR